MKKVLFLAAAAMALFAGCQKTNVVYDNEPQEIAFQVVNKVATKVPVADANFLAGDDMNVAAYLVSGDGATAGDFFKMTKFTKNGDKWTGGKYWPISTSTISFLAVTGKGGGVDKTETSFASPMGSKVTTKVTNNNVYDQNDVMYAASQVTRNQGNDYPVVDMLFHHAYAWINFKVKLAAGTGITVDVNSITLNNCVTDGTLTVENTAYNTVSTPSLTATWDISESAEVSQKVPNAGGTDEAGVQRLTDSDAPYGNGILVVPDGKAESFTINYTLTQNDGTAVTYNYTHTLTPTWEQAKKYTYNIGISLTEIEISPTVDPWDAEAATGVAIDK